MAAGSLHRKKTVCMADEESLLCHMHGRSKCSSNFGDGRLTFHTYGSLRSACPLTRAARTLLVPTSVLWPNLRQVLRPCICAHDRVHYAMHGRGRRAGGALTTCAQGATRRSAPYTSSTRDLTEGRARSFIHTVLRQACGRALANTCAGRGLGGSLGFAGFFSQLHQRFDRQRSDYSSTSANPACERP